MVISSSIEIVEESKQHLGRLGSNFPTGVGARVEDCKHTPQSSDGKAIRRKSTFDPDAGSVRHVGDDASVGSDQKLDCGLRRSKKGFLFFVRGGLPGIAGMESATVRRRKPRIKAAQRSADLRTIVNRRPRRCKLVGGIWSPYFAPMTIDALSGRFTLSKCGILLTAEFHRALLSHFCVRLLLRVRCNNYKFFFPDFEVGPIICESL